MEFVLDGKGFSPSPKYWGRSCDFLTAIQHVLVSQAQPKLCEELCTHCLAGCRRRCRRSHRCRCCCCVASPVPPAVPAGAQEHGCGPRQRLFKATCQPWPACMLTVSSSLRLRRCCICVCSGVQVRGCGRR